MSNTEITTDQNQATGGQSYAPTPVEMTFGEMLVGAKFNPSNDNNVAHAKRLCAELADLVNDQPHPESSQLSRRLYDHTIGEILNAQMNVVKFLTLKH